MYWFTLPKGHKMGDVLGVTRTTKGTKSYGGVPLNSEWHGKIKEHLGAPEADYGDAKNHHFTDAFDSVTDVTDNNFIIGSTQRNQAGPEETQASTSYYYLGPNFNRFSRRPIGGTEPSREVREKAKRNLVGLKENTDQLYYLKYDGAGIVTIEYKTTTDNKYAPLYYGAGMRSYENSSGKQYFMVRGLQEKPTGPTVDTNNEGTVTVNPYSNPNPDKNKNVDKVVLSYTNKNNEKKEITLIRNQQNGTWTSSGNGADGIQINGDSFSVKAGYAKPGSEVSAISSFGNSDASVRNSVTVPTDTQPPVVKIRTGQNTTTLPVTKPAESDPAVYEVTQGQPFAPRLEAFDNLGKIKTFTIEDGTLPTGVSLSSNVSSTANYTETSPYRPTFTGNVSNNFEPGTYTRNITVTDASNISKTYYFKYRVIARDTEAPTVKIVDKTNNNAETTLTDNVSNAPTIDVYRGATIELPLKYYDNNAAGKVNIQYGSGLPSGVWFNKNTSANSNETINESGKTESAQGSYTVHGRVDANARLGISTVTLKVSDAANGDVNQGNHKEVKFRVRVLDLDFEKGVSAQTGASKVSKEVEVNQAVGDPNNYLTVNDGSQRNDNLFPQGMKFRYISGTEYKTDLTYRNPGKYTVTAAAFYPTTYVPTNGESVTAANATGDNIDEIRGRAYVAREIEFHVKPTAPTVTPQENGDVVVAHTNQTNVNELSFTYTNGSGAQQTVTATKNGSRWTLDNPSIDGVTIDESTGAVTIKDRAVRDTAEVTAKVATLDRVNSNNTTATAKVGDRKAPTFEFNSQYTEEVNGQRVVYVTPTENLSNGSITLGTVKDDSGKLLQTVLFHGNGTSTNLEFGLSYNEKTKTTNGDFDAPHDIVITGKVPKINPKTNNIWGNNDSLVTRYVSATDAAENLLKDTTNQNSNPLRVQFKILTQAAKYTPQVGTQAINKDITANGASLSVDEFNAIKSKITFTANKGDVKVAYNTPDMNITMNENGAVKRNSNGTYYVGATVTYPDGTSEVIQIPVEKLDKIPPTVKMNGKELTENAADNHFIIYRGANFNPTFEVNDNSGVTTYLKAEGIPNGVWFNKQGNADSPKTGNMVNKTQYQLTTNNTVDSTAPLGDREARVTVKDALNNEKTYKFKYTIVDVDVKDSPKNVRLNSQLGDPHHFLTTTAANRVNSDDKYFPDGMRFKWIKNNQEVAQTTTLPTAGNITDYKVVADFANGATNYVKNIDGKDVTIYTPAKVEKPVTLIVTEDSPPTVKMTNPSNNQTTELSGDDSNSPIVTIYRNAQLDIPLSFYDNEATGRVNLQYVEGLPKGVTFGGTNNTVSVTGAVANANGTHTISGRVAADATLGMSTVTMKVSDGANGVASGNQGEVKFRIRVLDVDFEEAKSPEPNQSSITVETNVGDSILDPNYYLTVNDGTNRTDQGNFPNGMTFRYVSIDGRTTTRTLQYNAPGKYTVRARAYFPVNYAGTKGIGEEVSGQSGDNTEINGRRYIEKTIVFKVKPTTPVVAPQDNGDVVITQLNETNVNRLKVTYTTQGDNPQEVTYTASKNGDTWSFGSNVPISIDGAKGTVKIKDRLVQDGSTVKVQAITYDQIGSNEGTGDAKPGDAIYPTVDFQNTETDSEGNRVVYITPTETTDLPVVTINDNSGKLVSANFVGYDGNPTDLTNVNINFTNRVTKNSAETQHNAPITLNVTGTLPKQHHRENRLWRDGEDFAHIYADAEDAAGNVLHGSPGTKENSPSSKTRVVLKVKTQATKYTPTVTTPQINRDIRQPNSTLTDGEFNSIKDTLTFTADKGAVNVQKDTANLTFTSNKEVNKNADGSLYIRATVSYPDGSTEEIQIPVNAPAQKEFYIPTAVEKTVEKDSEPEARDSISNASNLPTNTKFAWKTGTLDTSTPGVKQATVTVTYSDKSSEEVTATVNVRPTKPTVTSANGDVTITPVNEPNVTKLVASYTPADRHQLEDNGTVTSTPQTATTIEANKGADNQWTITTGGKDGISINATTGAITLKDQVVKDQTTVTAKVAAQTIESAEGTGTSTKGDQTNPVIGASSQIVEAGKEINIPLDLSDTGVGIDKGNIKVTGLPTGLSYDTTAKSITGTLGTVSNNTVTVAVLDKNGNKADKTITITAVKPKAIYAIKDATIENVDNAANFVEVPEGVTLTAASWKDNDKPSTATVGTTNKIVTVSANGANTELTIPVTIYPKVTYRKVGGKEVDTYHEIVGQPLTSRLVPGGSTFNPVTPDYYIAFEGGAKPKGTRVEFKDGAPDDTSTIAGITTKTIKVTYPDGEVTAEKTVTFKTYGNEVKYEDGKDSIETIVGTTVTARNSIKLSNPNLGNPSGTVIGWWKNRAPYTPDNKIGEHTENVNVWYGYSVRNARGDNTDNYSDQNIAVNITIKPQAPTIEENALRGKGTTKPNVSVGNLPTNNQLETGARVTVELYSGDKKVASKTVNGGTTSVEFNKNDYTDNLTYSEKVHAVVKVEGGSGTTAYNLSSANSNDVQVTPQKPTFDATAVTSTSRTLSGTLGGFDDANKVVEVHLNDEHNTVLSSANSGEVTITGDKWTAKLPDNVKLRQSVAKNGETAKPSGIIVENKVAGTTISTTSDAKEVAMGAYSVSPAIAGSKHIDITVPHDAKRVELRFHNSTETGNKANSITLVRGADGTWHTEATRADNTSVTDANGYVGNITSKVNPDNKAENIVTIPLNEQNGANKLHLKEEEANGDGTANYSNGLGLRVEYQPEAGQDPTAAGNWKVANVTNTAPALAHKGTEGTTEANRKVYPSGTSITKEMLAELVTVTDPEDNATDVNNKPYGSPTIEIVSGLTETPGKATAPDIYTVTLKATDSQGRESNELTVYVEVRKQKDENDPGAKTPNQEVSHNAVPDAETSVDTSGLPAGTRYS